MVTYRLADAKTALERSNKLAAEYADKWRSGRAKNELKEVAVHLGVAAASIVKAHQALSAGQGKLQLEGAAGSLAKASVTIQDSKMSAAAALGQAATNFDAARPHMVVAGDDDVLGILVNEVQKLAAALACGPTAAG